MSEKPKHMFVPTCTWQATSQWSGDLDIEADPNYNHILTKVRSNVHSTTTQVTWGTRSNKKSACPGQHTIIHSCGAGKRSNISDTFQRLKDFDADLYADIEDFVPILCRFLHKNVVINSSDFFCVPYLKKKVFSQYSAFSRILLFFVKTSLMCIVCTMFGNFLNIVA